MVSIITAAGCSLERQPMNGPSSATFPASEEEALAGVYAAYKGLTLEDLQSTTFPYRIEDDATDIGSYRVGNENLIKQMNGTLTSESYPPRWIYEDIYQVAGRVHLVLDNLDRLKGVCDEQTIAQFRAELLCIRALQYNQACQFFGKETVPVGIQLLEHGELAPILLFLIGIFKLGKENPSSTSSSVRRVSRTTVTTLSCSVT